MCVCVRVRVVSLLLSMMAENELESLSSDLALFLKEASFRFMAKLKDDRFGCIVRLRATTPRNAAWSCVCVCMCEHECVCMFACVHVYVCVLVCMCMYVCMCVCMPLHYRV